METEKVVTREECGCQKKDSGESLKMCAGHEVGAVLREIANSLKKIEITLVNIARRP